MRDYDPTLGRYIQADPLGLVDGASAYNYALQNPGRYTDPTGEFIPQVAIFIAFLVVDYLLHEGCYTTSDFLLSVVTNLNPYKKADAIQRMAKRAKRAAKARQKSASKGVPPSKVGPSGKPKINTVDHPSRKRAKDAARRDGQGKPINRPSDIGQPPHYHPTNKNGQKKGKQSPHHNYPNGKK